MASLVEPVTIAGRTAPSRVLFGPHETNLGRGRGLSDRHMAYYRERAAGGAGIIVVGVGVGARLGLALRAGARWRKRVAPGWADVAAACDPFGTVVLAGLGHCGAQGSSAYSQSVMWAPSGVADVVSREMPMEMGPPEIETLVEGFARATRRGAPTPGSTEWRSTSARCRCCASSTPG